MNARPHVEIIAEAGVNHDGSLAKALELVTVAHEAGADAVKFQTFHAHTLAVAGAGLADYQKKGGAAADQKDMLKALELDKPAFREIAAHAARLGIRFLSTPFDTDSLDFLVGELGMDAIKISSGDLTNGPLLLAAARTGIPLILSTGMATEAEISDALGLVSFALGSAAKPPSRAAFSAAWQNAEQREAARKQMTLLQCTSQYPAPVGDSNLRAMATLREKFGVLVGLSDHTEGVAIGIAAAALGACMIEKHFTLDRAAIGPDHRASLDPEALTQLVRGVRDVESALGDGIKRPRPSEIDVQAVARRSLVAAREIRKGEIFTEDNVTAKRPASGRSPMDIWDVLGTFAQRDFRPDDFIP